MFGHNALSQFPFSTFEFIAYVPPPPLEATGTDGYNKEEAKRYLLLQQKLEAATKARDRAKKATKDGLRQLIAEQVDPDKYVKPIVKTFSKDKPRPILKTKPVELLEANVADIRAQLHQVAYAMWQNQERERLRVQERMRAQEQDDLEALLLLL